MDGADAADVIKSIPRKKGDAGHHAEGGNKGGDEHETGTGLVGGEPDGGAAAYGLAINDDMICGYAETFCEVVPGSLAGIVAAFFIRFPLAATVSGVIVGEDAVSASVKSLKPLLEVADVLGIAVAPE